MLKKHDKTINTSLSQNTGLYAKCNPELCFISAQSYKYNGKANGAPELTLAFCTFDNLWGDLLKGDDYRVRFERPTTIAAGDDSCRFEFWRVPIIQEVLVMTHETKWYNQSYKQSHSKCAKPMPTLDIATLCAEAAQFAADESQHLEPRLFGVSDGKAIGTYLEHKFRAYLRERYTLVEGNSASGIDFPALNVDMKATSIRQPQSSCPFRSARQKIYGLGYSLLIFVYDKQDLHHLQSATLQVLHVVFVNAEQTGDYQTTRGIRTILANDGNHDDLVAFLLERNLPLDEIGINDLASEIMQNIPEQGYLTISNALQWRLQYSRVIERAGSESGILSLYNKSV
jgi:hypothetical protein